MGGDRWPVAGSVALLRTTSQVPGRKVEGRHSATSVATCRWTEFDPTAGQARSVAPGAIAEIKERLAQLPRPAPTSSARWCRSSSRRAETQFADAKWTIAKCELR